MKQQLERKDITKLSAMQKAWLLLEIKKLGKKITVTKQNVIVLPLLTIGDLIAILERNGFFDIESEYEYHIHVDYDGWHVRAGKGEGEDSICYSDTELIYALWDAVKAVCGKQG